MRCCTSIADTNINVHTRHVIWCRDQTNTSGVHVIWTSSSKTITIGITKSLTLLRNCKKKKKKKKKKRNQYNSRAISRWIYLRLYLYVYFFFTRATYDCFFSHYFRIFIFFSFFFSSSIGYSRSIPFFSIVYLHAYKHTIGKDLLEYSRE